jgi:hypothetical protein
MAKRTRGGTRPGRRTPLRQAPQRPSPATRPSTSLTPDEEARAAALEAQILAEERAASQAAIRTRERAREAEVAPRPVAREALPLSVRAADEYAYVRRDVWRIGRIGALLLGLMAVLYVLINVLHVFSI